MSRGAKILIVIASVLAGLCLTVYLVVKYTTWGLPYRVSRLHDQIETRYASLQQTYESKEAQAMLVDELTQNRLVRRAEFRGDKLELCYVDETCEDFYVGIED